MSCCTSQVSQNFKFPRTPQKNLLGYQWYNHYGNYQDEQTYFLNTLQMNALTMIILCLLVLCMGGSTLGVTCGFVAGEDEKSKEGCGVSSVMFSCSVCLGFAFFLANTSV